MTAARRQTWTELRDRIHGLILNSTYVPGDKLPRDEVLARAFGCARSTVQRAIRQTPAPVVAAFGLSAPCAMLRIEALHGADGRPCLFGDRRVPFDKVPEIAAVDPASIGANEWLVLHRPSSRRDLRLHAVSADSAAARVLQTGPGGAVLGIERTAGIADAPTTHPHGLTRPGYQLVARA